MIQNFPLLLTCCLLNSRTLRSENAEIGIIKQAGNFEKNPVKILGIKQNLILIYIKQVNNRPAIWCKDKFSTSFSVTVPEQIWWYWDQYWKFCVSLLFNSKTQFFFAESLFGKSYLVSLRRISLPPIATRKIFVKVELEKTDEMVEDGFPEVKLEGHTW